jgi:hypothetical protein
MSPVTALSSRAISASSRAISSHGETRWATLDEVKGLAEAGTALIPDEVWLFERALQCFDLWSPQDVDIR